MRIESSVTSISWIPSEAIKGMTKLPFDMGVARYDEPPPDRIDGEAALAGLRDEGRFRFAQRLHAWIEVHDGEIVDHGCQGTSYIGVTELSVGRSLNVAPVPLPDILPEPEVGGSWVRFRRTAGGRTGVPAPRRVSHPPFVQISAPLAWTTLELTLHVDGRSDGQLSGASPFPRHWIYGHSGDLAAKSGMIDFKQWYRHAFGKHSPWGEADSPALATAVETALERDLSTRIMRSGAKPQIRKLKEGRMLVEQGEEGDELFLLLDGVLRVEVDGEPLAELGPGAVVGERALLEGGRRTSTLRALTPAKVAVATGADIEAAVLEQLREGHRREEQHRAS